MNAERLPDQPETCSTLFAVLADETNVRVLLTLADGPMSMSALCAIPAPDRSSIDQAIGRLAGQGWIVGDQRSCQLAAFVKPEPTVDRLGITVDSKSGDSVTISHPRSGLESGSRL